MYGSIRVDELIIPITGLRLVRDGIEIHGTIKGPQEPCEGIIRVFTATGEPVTENARGEARYVCIPRARAQDTLDVSYTIWFEHINDGKDNDARLRT